MVMFGPAGHAYVYFSYGMHYCLNVTAERAGTAGAVLIRALEPLAGIDLVRAHGDHGPAARLLSGPGKIGRAFGLTLQDNGRDFTRGALGISAARLLLTVRSPCRDGSGSRARWSCPTASPSWAARQ